MPHPLMTLSTSQSRGDPRTLTQVGGIVYVATHFSYAAHERPWNFFQFSDMGLRVLFPECMGFECIAAGMSDPIVGRFSSLAAEWDRYKPIRAVW